MVTVSVGGIWSWLLWLGSSPSAHGPFGEAVPQNSVQQSLRRSRANGVPVRALWGGRQHCFSLASPATVRLLAGQPSLEAVIGLLEERIGAARSCPQSAAPRLTPYLVPLCDGWSCDPRPLQRAEPVFLQDLRQNLWIRRRLVGLDRRCDLLVDRSDRLVERVDLTDERAKRHAYAVGKQDLAVLVEAAGGQALQVVCVLRALRGDDADIGQVTAQRVEKRGALTGELR